MRILLLLLLFPILTYSQIKTITDINPNGSGVGGNAIARLNNKLIFNGKLTLYNNEPWTCELDGNNAVQLEDLYLNGSSNPYEFTTVGNRVYFKAFGDLVGRELYFTDGNSVFLSKDIRPGQTSSDPQNFIVSEDTLYFSASTNDGDQFFMASTDTIIQITFFEQIATSPGDFLVFNGNLYFGGKQHDSLGYELYKWQAGFTEPRLVKDIYPGSLDGVPEQMQVVNNRLYFSGTNNLGAEIWTSDGTTDGTYLLADLNPGSEDGFPRSFTALDENRFIFTATYPSLGTELWISDGTTDGTIFLKDVREGSFASNPGGLIHVNGRVFFSAYSEGTGNELWITDGTEAGTRLVKDINPGTASANFQDKDWLSYGNNLYFTAEDGNHGLELWKSDGTEAGTQMVQDYAVGPSDARPSTLTEYNGIIYFMITSDTVGRELGMYTPVDPCNGIACPLGEVCVDGTCLEPCETITCPDSLYCNGLKCVTPSDPCSGITCPLGQVCYDGSCYDPCETCTDSAFNCYGGICYEKDPCDGVSCPLGEVCYNGTCSYPGTVKSKTIQFLSASDSTPVEGVTVRELGVRNLKSFTDENGYATIKLLDGNRALDIQDSTGSYQSVVLRVSDQQNIIFLEPLSGCENVVCPLGQVCYEGSCYEPTTTIYSGYVKSNFGTPLPGVKIIGSANINARTDSNGYFSFIPILETDSVKVNVYKSSFINIKFTLGPGNSNRITLVRDPLCGDHYCPLGEVCFAGSCYTSCEDSACVTPLKEACENVVCPLGQVCYEGSCYTSCSDAESFCQNNLDDPCENVSIPPGYVCRQGVIVPKCPENTSACNSDSICSYISCGPDAEACFQCWDTTDYNTSGNSEITGSLSLNEEGNNLKRTTTTKEGDIFIFLINARTGRKVAISKTDDDGSFQFNNLPKGDYKVFVAIPDYFMPDSEQIISLEANQKTLVTITTEEDLLQVEQEITSGLEVFSTDTDSNYWYPVPNEGNGFYFQNETNNSISDFKITDLFGKTIATNQQLKTTGNQLIFIPIEPLPAGIYLFSWTEGKKTILRTQKVSVIH